MNTNLASLAYENWLKVAGTKDCMKARYAYNHGTQAVDYRSVEDRRKRNVR